MITEFVFATNNKNKLTEVREIAAGKFRILSLDDINCHEEIPEDQDTLEGNALQKANFISEKYGVNCFADDTGLEIDSLRGAPGVYSARYAGEARNSSDNIKKVLSELSDSPYRDAQFRTVVSLIINKSEYFFEGIIRGEIISELKGDNGFGYDPIFVPKAYNETFAELPSFIKNTISHRAIAIEKLFNFLRHY